jgi:hypothetical protein
VRRSGIPLETSTHSNPNTIAATAWLSSQARSPFAHHRLSAPGRCFSDLAIATKAEKYINNLSATLGGCPYQASIGGIGVVFTGL